MSMKSFVRSGPFLLVFLIAMSLASRARATVVWTAGFESNKSGDVCASTMAGAEFTPAVLDVNGTRVNAQVLGEQVYSGKLSCKVTVHPDDIFTKSYNQNRVDVKHTSTLTGEGADMYLSGYYYLPADAQTRNEFGMFETLKSLNWIDIWIEPKTGGGTTLNLGIESNGAKLGSVPVWNGDLSIGSWHQLAIHVHWSQDATKGSLDFWLDGKQVVTAFKHKTRPDGTDLYFLTGLHRVVMQPYTESIYFDDFIEADTQDEIKIGAPMATVDAGMPPDAAGGAGTSGGAAGSGGGGGQAAAGAQGAAGTQGAAGNTGGTSGVSGSAGSSSTGEGGGSSSSTGAGGVPSNGGAGAAGTGATGAAGMTTTESPHGRGGSSGCSIAGPCGFLGGYWLAAASCAAILQRRRRARRR
jgi:hypothetical protein